ncbi:MAG: hypothetical protein AWU54_1443 [Candidatus Frackibacter sp. T328-2]|nr:MAG: hypothetical protein AWU54_1443 [Candidatus Frackibacter sp. T328-2]
MNSENKNKNTINETFSMVALEEVEENKNTKYDVQVTDVCLDLFRENKFKF